MHNTNITLETDVCVHVCQMYNMMSAYQGGPVLLSVETQDASQTYPQPFAV